MKLSKREKLFLFVLLVSIVIYAGNKYIPTLLSSKNHVNEDYNKICDVYSNMIQNIKMKELYEEKRRELLVEINSMNMLSDIKQENILEILYRHLSSCGVEIININFSEVTPLEINSADNEVLIESSAENQTVNTISNSNSNLNINERLSTLTTLVDIEFRSSYEQVLTLIDELKENKNNMAITNIHLIKSDYNNIYGVMSVRFYAILKQY